MQRRVISLCRRCAPSAHSARAVGRVGLLVARRRWPTPAAIAGGICGLAGEAPGVGVVLSGGCEVASAPFKLAEWLVGNGWSALNGLLGGVPKKLAGALSKVVEDGANTVLNGVSGWIASGAVWLVSRVATLTPSTTSPQVSAAWFRGSYAVMVQLALALGSAARPVRDRPRAVVARRR